MPESIKQKKKQSPVFLGNRLQLVIVRRAKAFSQAFAVTLISVSYPTWPETIDRGEILSPRNFACVADTTYRGLRVNFRLRRRL